MFKNHRMFITAVVVFIALIAGVAYGQEGGEYDPSDVAGALAEELCGDDGVDQVGWWGRGDGEYVMLARCGDGSHVVSGFRMLEK